MSSIPSFDELDEALLMKIEADPMNFESFQIEYKIDFHNDVNELRSDIIAFANGSLVGFLFFGIQDSPIKVIGIEKTKVDAIKTILNDVLPKKIDPILSPFPIFKPIPLSNGKYVVAIKIIPKENGIYGIRQGDNPSAPNFLTYEFWVRMDGSKRRLKIEDIEEIILSKGGVEKKKLKVSLNPVTLAPTITKEAIISIQAVNISTRPIIIQEYGIMHEDEKIKITIAPPKGITSGKLFYDGFTENMLEMENPQKILGTDLPKTLNDGESCSAYIIRKKFDELSKENGYTFPLKVKAYFRSNEEMFYSDLIELQEWK
ncbi:MAG: ATP-binding protein [Candidatus Lokiarchaeota archaeon]|nr:ATP-binding protein [Candidatus Harpocratesius repetitus]